jgi:hypothetical protein
MIHFVSLLCELGMCGVTMATVLATSRSQRDEQVTASTYLFLAVSILITILSFFANLYGSAAIFAVVGRATRAALRLLRPNKAQQVVPAHQMHHHGSTSVWASGTYDKFGDQRDTLQKAAALDWQAMPQSQQAQNWHAR